MTVDGQRNNSVVGGNAVLLVRGLLLWVVVPMAAIVWPVAALSLRRRLARGRGGTDC
jgi:hypothetical protein